MKLIRANQVSYEALEQFLIKNENVDGRKLAHDGYVVEIDGNIEGCFVLQQVETGNYWLKQLYITQSEAAKLPVLLEAILALAKENEAKHVHVHSHQPVVDLLLEALQFHPQPGNPFPEKTEQMNGNWWRFHVS